MNRGYIKIWRKLEDSGLLQLPYTLALFMHILMKATHKERKVGTPTGVIDLQRGQYISGRHRLAEILKQSEQQIRTSLNRLEQLEIITTTATNRYSIYTIVNYNNYQDDNQQDNQQITNKQPTDNQQTTTKQTLKHLSIETLEEKPKAAVFALPDWIDKAHWDLWLKKRKGKKLDDEQKAMQVNKLNRWRIAGLDYALSLENAASSGYQGLVEPKAQSVGRSQSVQEARLDVARQIFGDQNGTHRPIRDITPGRTIEGDGASIPETHLSLRKPDAG